MLVLSRKVGDTITIGDNIVVSINRISGNRVTVGIEAPLHVRVSRSELFVPDTLPPNVPSDQFPSLPPTEVFNDMGLET
jgi:carbon storage regulator